MKNIPPTYFYLGIIISFLLYFFVPKMNIIQFPFNLLGILLMAWGFYLISISYFLFKKHNTPEKFEKSTYLVQERIYKYSRNPMYAGGVIFLIGLSTLLGNIISYVSPLIFFLIMNNLFIPFEEKKTADEFGKKYLEYKNKVRRWI